MVFFKPLLLVVGAYALYSYFFGSSDAPPPPQPHPPPPRSRSPQRGQRAPAQLPHPSSHLYSSSAPAHHAATEVCRCDSCQRRRRRTTENVTEHQRLSSINLQRHISQAKSSPTEPYRSPDQQHPKIELLRNVEASNEDDERDPRYLHLRREAKGCYDLMAKSFDESRRAYSQKEGARAKELSNQGQQYKKLMEHYDEQASEYIFERNNTDIRPYTVDLHGLYVREAIKKTKQKLKEARSRRDPFIQFIVGKGLHCKDGNVKLKPKVEEFIRESGLSSRIDESNLGVLIVDLYPTHQLSSGDAMFRDRTNFV